MTTCQKKSRWMIVSVTHLGNLTYMLRLHGGSEADLYYQNKFFDFNYLFPKSPIRKVVIAPYPFAGKTWELRMQQCGSATNICRLNC